MFVTFTVTSLPTGAVVGVGVVVVGAGLSSVLVVFFFLHDKRLSASSEAINNLMVVC